jgi:uncharacterized membrane protein
MHDLTRRLALRSERGAVSIVLLGFFPVLIVFLMLVFNYGSYTVDKRYLQLQADAAALAGASQLVAGDACDASTITAVRNEAQEYVDANRRNNTPAADISLALDRETELCDTMTVATTVRQDNVRSPETRRRAPRSSCAA